MAIAKSSGSSADRAQEFSTDAPYKSHHNPEPFVAPCLLKSPAEHLFRRGDMIGGTGLPFVVYGESSILFWHAPEEDGDDDASLGRASAFGKRSAAAYFLHVQGRGPDDVPLNWIAADMAKQPQSRVAQLAFWDYLSRLMWLYGQQVAPAQIAGDVEAVIEEDRNLSLDDVVSVNYRRSEAA